MLRVVDVRLLSMAAIAAAVLMSFITDQAAEAAPKKFPVPAKRAAQQIALPAPTGLAASHSMSIENGRMCFADHYHYGSSDSQPTVRMAQMAAAKSWADFVDFEYGSTWTNFAKSASREFKCNQNSTGFTCDVSARPCR
jgi:hypothetical protein